MVELGAAGKTSRGMSEQSFGSDYFPLRDGRLFGVITGLERNNRAPIELVFSDGRSTSVGDAAL